MNINQLMKDEIAKYLKATYNAFDYEQLFELMVRYSHLGVVERKIIEYLFPHELVKMTRNELASAIGSDKSDVGKMVHKLEQRGIIHIIHKYNEQDSQNHATNPMIGCYIVEGWLENLLKMDINK